MGVPGMGVVLVPPRIGVWVEPPRSPWSSMTAVHGDGCNASCVAEPPPPINNVFGGVGVKL